MFDTWGHCKLDGRSDDDKRQKPALSTCCDKTWPNRNTRRRDTGPVSLLRWFLFTSKAATLCQVEAGDRRLPRALLAASAPLAPSAPSAGAQEETPRPRANQWALSTGACLDQVSSSWLTPPVQTNTSSVGPASATSSDTASEKAALKVHKSLYRSQNVIRFHWKGCSESSICTRPAMWGFTVSASGTEENTLKC